MRRGVFLLQLSLLIAVMPGAHGQTTPVESTAAPPLRNLLQFRMPVDEAGMEVLVRDGTAEVLVRKGTVEAPRSDGDLVRLRIDRSILEACRPDLSDVRLFQGDRELPFAVRRTPSSQRRLLRTVTPEVGPRVEQSAASLDARAPLRQRETYSLSAPPADGAGWSLRLEVPESRGPFVRSARLSWFDDATGPTATFWQGSFFRLRDGRRRVEVELPPAAGRWLLIELEGQDGERELEPLEPGFGYRLTRLLEADTRELSVDVEARHARQDGVDVYRFALPPGLLPGALRIATSSGTYRRVARVLGASRDDGPLRLVGSAVLRGSGVGAGSAQGTDTIPLEASGVTRYELHIDSGDSPPLADLVIAAMVAAPELVFEWPGSGVELFYGGGRVRAPRYDLATLVPSDLPAMVAAEDLSLLEALLGDESLPLVYRGDASTANESFIDEPLLSFLQRPGAAVDPGPFSHRSDLVLGASRSGLYRVDLGAEILSLLSRDLGDLRFVDDRGQWPYLLEPNGRWSIDLAVETEQDGARTRLSLRLPAALQPSGAATALRADRLDIVVEAPFFDRPARLAPLRDAERLLVDGRLVGAAPRTAFYSPGLDRRTVTLRFAESGAADLLLTVENGDDAPLDFVSAELSGPGREALVVAPEGRYVALLGATRGNDIDPPSYELRRAADLVRSLRPTTAGLADPEPNPYAKRPSVLDGLPWDRVLLWGAVALAVLGLGWIIMRSVGDAPG